MVTHGIYRLKRSTVTGWVRQRTTVIGVAHRNRVIEVLEGIVAWARGWKVLTDHLGYPAMYALRV